MTVCSRCWAPIGRGIKGHAFCGKRPDCLPSKRRINCMKFVNNLPETRKEQIAHKIIKDKVDMSSSSKTNRIALRSHGHPAIITVNDKKSRKVLFPAQSLNNYQSNTNASLGQMKNLTNFIRSHAVR